MAFSRRDFLTTAVVGSLSLGLEGQEQKEQDSKRAQTRTLAGKLPILVSSANGYNYLDDAYNFLGGGSDTLDAALRGTDNLFELQAYAGLATLLLAPLALASPTRLTPRFAS